MLLIHSSQLLNSVRSRFGVETLTPTPLPQGEGLELPFSLREKGPGVEGQTIQS